MKSTRSGFTLVEILVVIVIIAALGSVITLVAKRALQSAREAHGMSNLKQVVSAAVTYASDQNGRLPYAQKAGNSLFYTELGAMINGSSGDGTWNGKENYNDVFKVV
jgi:prepilin-type N-terminal cleavage/methylation domain-containing protein